MSVLGESAELCLSFEAVSMLQGKRRPIAALKLGEPRRSRRNGRVYCPVTTRATGRVLADIITGTLFNARTGECLSSPHLRLDVSALGEVVAADDLKRWVKGARGRSAAAESSRSAGVAQ